jgi:AcrR family transcriptional regulator
VTRAPEATATARTGRPRDQGIDAALLKATIAVLEESGYSGLTLEKVAREAGTTKPSIYRRWPTRQRLVVAALGGRLGVARAPDTGCTLCDLDECLKLFVAAFRRMPPGVIGPLFADCAGDRELRAAFMAALFDPPRAAVRETLEPGDRRHSLGRERLDPTTELVPPDREALDVVAILGSESDHDVEQAQRECRVRAGNRCQVLVRLCRRAGSYRVDRDDVPASTARLDDELHTCWWLVRGFVPHNRISFEYANVSGSMPSAVPSVYSHPTPPEIEQIVGMCSEAPRMFQSRAPAGPSTP